MIPARFVPQPPRDGEVREFCELCNAIEEGLEQKRDVTELLAKWNRRANRVHSASEFTSYYKAVDIDEFVGAALAPRPELVPDLTYAELRAVLESVVNAELVGADHSYFLEWLAAQLPDSHIDGLIYGPGEWFGTRDAAAFEFTEDQLLCAAMERSGRVLADAPSVSIPFKVPVKTVLVTPPARE